MFGLFTPNLSRVQQQVLQAFGELVAARQKGPTLGHFEVKRSTFRVNPRAALSLFGALIASPNLVDQPQQHFAFLLQRPHHNAGAAPLPFRE